ncbi:hypothetical protein OPW07_24245 [Vibrio europaeus]|uniref:hypothetical protein n=1 Tax=Vibrio europaeus TaxID=300876 RepID=UPI0018A71DA3|nr:hypothetical protein [Vibrio europaeus]MDC5812835.1 hypothetical protein [Vibrio europaeus]QPG37629.1 hypothetical protein IXK98_15080 [Vibrio europaeus]
MKINYSLANVLITDDNVKLYCRLKLAELCEYLPKGQSLANRVARLNPVCELQDFLMLLDEHKKGLEQKAIPSEAKPKKAIASRDLLGRLAIINQGANQAFVLPKGVRFNTHSAYAAFNHTQLNQLPIHQQTFIKRDLRCDDILRLEPLRESDLRFYTIICLDSVTSELQESVTDE